MSCRCSDITHCKKDIATIKFIASALTNSKSTNETVLSEHTYLSATSNETFSIRNIGELIKAEIELNKDVHETIPNLIDRCDSKIEKLERELDSLKREDHRYHEEKSKKHDND